MAAVLKITDGTTTVDLLEGKGKFGFHLVEWTPAVADYKEGGTWQDSPIAEGRRLADRRFQNAIETFTVSVDAPTQDEMAYRLQEARRFFEAVSDFWVTDWYRTPAWIEASAGCETGTRYAVVHRASLVSDSNYYAQPFARQGSAIMANLTLMVERGHWQDCRPGQGLCARASAVEEWCFGADVSHLIFNGDTSRVNCGSDAGLDNLHGAAFTAEAWTKPASYGEGNAGRVFDKTGSGAAGWYLCYEATARLTAVAYFAGTNAWSSGDVAAVNPVDGSWHHVAATYDNAGAREFRLWIDGFEVTYAVRQTSVGAVSSDAAADFFIGNRSDLTFGYDGRIGWTRVSNVLRYP